jgi:protein involved in polysaccharide export with SLBB domain
MLINLRLPSAPARIGLAWLGLLGALVLPLRILAADAPATGRDLKLLAVGAGQPGPDLPVPAAGVPVRAAGAPPPGTGSPAPVPAGAAPGAPAGPGGPEPPGPALPADPVQAQDREVLARLRRAYQGPFLLASDLFDDTASFSPPLLGNVSDDYLLGPGDAMQLFVFGSATFEVPLEVDRAGSLTIPRIGSARVAGLRLGDARRVVQRLVDSLYAGARVDLLFSKTRDVTLFILGEVYRPGSYRVPSLTSLLNALAASGGPRPYGSYRAIQLLRAGRVVQTLDLYQLRLRGQGMENLLLRDGDTLFVPVVGVQVLMDGAFVRVLSSPVRPDHPGVLVELKPGETAWDALQFAGGLLPSAYQRLITLQRKDPNGVVSVLDLPATEAFLRGQQVFPEDKLVALAQAEWTGQVVRVAGYAKVPGTFAQRPGMRVADLLREPNQIQPDTYLERGQVVRTHEDGSTELRVFNVAKALRGDPAENLLLEPRDQVELFKVEDLRLDYTVKVVGPFTHPGTFPWHGGMRAADLIFAAGIPKLNADRYYAELAHLDPRGQPGPAIRLDLARLLYSDTRPAPALGDPAVNLPLQPFDQITLYEIPNFRVHHTVTVTGQVRRPGTYVITDKHFTLRQLIQRAGGLTEEAMPKGGIFLRMSLREKDLTQADLKKAGIKDPDPTGQGINEILQRLSETKRSKDNGSLLTSPVLHGLLEGTTSRLVVDFLAALAGDPARDVELLDGDQIILPRQVQSAYVVGEVASPFATFRVWPGNSVKDLMRLAGGFTRNADQGEVRLLKADGRILDSRVLGQPIEPGDAVLVPQKFKLATSWQENLQALTPLALILNAIRR